MDQGIARFEMDLTPIVEFERDLALGDINEIDGRGCVQAGLVILHMGGAARKFFFEFEAGRFRVEFVRCRNRARRYGKHNKPDAARLGKVVGP